MVDTQRDIIEIGILAIKNALGDSYRNDSKVHWIMPYQFKKLCWNEEIREADTPQEWIDITLPTRGCGAGFVIIGILNYHTEEDTPKLLEVRTQLNRRIYPPTDFRRTDPSGNQGYSLHQTPTLIILPGDKLRLKISCNKRGHTQLIPIGICMGADSFINKL